MKPLTPVTYGAELPVSHDMALVEANVAHQNESIRHFYR